jgi:hypothetical protein
MKTTAEKIKWQVGKTIENSHYQNRNYISYQRGKTMTTEIIANETEIKQAMNELGIESWVDRLLDEIELNRRLKKSLEQADRGETFPIEVLKKQVMEKFANV